MAERLDKTEVLSRTMLGYVDRPQDIRVQGDWGENFVWHGGDCYIPVIYHGQAFKRKIGIKPRGLD